MSSQTQQLTTSKWLSCKSRSEIHQYFEQNRHKPSLYFCETKTVTMFTIKKIKSLEQSRKVKHIRPCSQWKTNFLFKSSWIVSCSLFLPGTIRMVLKNPYPFTKPWMRKSTFLSQEALYFHVTLKLFLPCEGEKGLNFFFQPLESWM